jgi:serine/threonine-protein kinase ATR
MESQPMTNVFSALRFDMYFRSPTATLTSHQAIFMLMDHLNKWVRLVRQEAASKKPDGGTRRGRAYEGDAMEERLLRVDSILSNIPRSLVARAAFQCKAFARSLMSFEGQVFDLKANDAAEADLQPYYEHLHEIYANLDEPDGMEGVSTLVLLPSLEHKIRQHESTGRWTSAQSCWEVKLQNNPDNLDYHIGLLRCLRNLGHYG